MKKTLVSVSGQWRNYRGVLSWLFGGYYRAEKKAFWLVQLLMGLSTVTGFLWMTGILLGFGRKQNWGSGRLALLAPVYDWPMWQWLAFFSLFGVLSAVAFYYSFQVGVDSTLRYQTRLFRKVLARHVVDTVEQKQGVVIPSTGMTPPSLPSPVSGAQLANVLRLLKTNTHMAGLVSRRLTRAFIPALTSMAGTIALFLLQPGLTVLLIPLFVIYAIGLYRINAHAAEISMALNAESLRSTRNIRKLVAETQETPELLADEARFNQAFHSSHYPQLARLKYQRRLVDIHVNWLKTFLLVFAIVLMVAWFGWQHSSGGFDWAALLMYLIVMRFTANALGVVGAASVAFSRFYPEIKALAAYLDGKTAMEQIPIDDYTEPFDDFDIDEE